MINTASNVYRRARLDLDDLDGIRRRYRNHQAYPASKLATILFTQELARRTRGTGITASAFHPGVVATDLGRDSPVFRLVMNSWLGRAALATPRGAPSHCCTWPPSPTPRPSTAPTSTGSNPKTPPASKPAIPTWPGNYGNGQRN